MPTEVHTTAEWDQQHGRGWATRPLPASFAALHYTLTDGPAAGASFDEDAEHVRYVDRVGHSRFGAGDFDASGRDLWPGPAGAGVSYTILVSLSARLFRGHEIDRRSSHTKGHNFDGVGVSVMYSGGPVPDAVLDALAVALCVLVEEGTLTSPKFDAGHRDVYSTKCPGDYLYEKIPEINRRAAALYRQRKADMAVTSALGWTRPTSSGTRRVGPHVAHPDNPREILFRNEATADLLSAAMWLIHTGNGRKSDRVYVSQWHGARLPDADFGVALSDHKCWVAMDVNWSVHPWETRTGTAAYDRHMAAGALAGQHAMFVKIEERLNVPGQVPILRWCGRDWTNARGVGFLRRYGNRDCMHWQIAEPDWSRINGAAARLREWFRPPKSVADVKKLQGIVGVKQDGVWGYGSVDAMWAWEAEHGLTPTGLPGTEAFWGAYGGSGPVTPPKNEGYPESEIKVVQTALNRVMRGDPDVGKLLPLDVDGILGQKTRDVVSRFQRLTGLEVDGVPGPATQSELDLVVSRNDRFSMQEIREFQQVAKVLGYAPGDADGILGPATRAAVVRLQTDAKALGYYDQPIDEFPGEKTMEAARRMVEDQEKALEPEPDPDPVPGDVPFVRLAGRNTAHTSWLVLQQAQHEPVPGKLYLAVPEDAPSAAAARDGVVLVTTSSERLSKYTQEALEEYLPTMLVVVGGTAAITDTQERAARRAASGGES